jgi:hypothetical protein
MADIDEKHKKIGELEGKPIYEHDEKKHKEVKK